MPDETGKALVTEMVNILASATCSPYSITLLGKEELSHLVARSAASSFPPLPFSLAELLTASAEAQGEESRMEDTVCNYSQKNLKMEVFL